MIYKNVQFIAYCINTAPKAQWDGAVWKQEYLGLPNPLNDIKARVALVGKAINLAKKNSKKDSTVLKIFMIPEFFFRGARGAYSMPDVQTVIEGLQELVKDKQWKNWIFVFGTIVGFSSPTRTVSGGKQKREEIDENKEKEIYNFTLVQQGGFENVNNAHQYANIVQKELKSGIDFIKAKDMSGSGLAWERVIPLKPLTTSGRNELSNLKYEGLSVFKRHDITFGLEVCLDHANKRLKNSKNLLQIDIQLIPSCGMSINSDAIVVRNGGYVFNCDGITGPDRSPLENTGIEIGTFNDGTKAYDSHSALLNKQNGKVDPLNASVTKKKISVDVSKIYAKGAGQLHIYPSQSLPTASSTLSSSKSIFPRSESSFTTALSGEPILLNGMKVIFDQPIPVYPVNLQPKD